MTDRPITRAKLEKSLKEAEDILETLRNHEVDAVLGTDQIAMMRLKQVEDQLHEQVQISSNRLKEIESIYQNVPIGLCILDKDLKFIRINNHLAFIHGIPVDEHLEKKITSLLPDLDADLEIKLQDVIESGKPKLNVELRGKTPAQPGEERRWLHHWLPLYNQKGDVIGINMVVEEITERKKYEEKLKELNSILEGRVAERTKVAEERANKLREMAVYMTQIEEEERQRLARVLHDGLQQLLIGAKFNTRFLMNQLEDENLKKELTSLNNILDQSIEASRSLSYELSPPILHDQGLLPALEWLSESDHMKGLNIKINADEDLPELSQNLKVFLFQVVREFLINIIKHAKIDTAEVNLYSKENDFYVEVIDRGVGFDTAHIENLETPSQGLRNIIKKLDLLNGNLDIKSEPGKGSFFKLCVPVSDNPDSLTQANNTGKKSINPSKEIKRGKDEYTIENGTIQVLVVDDHQVMRDGLVRLINSEPDIQIVGEASNGKEAVDFVKKTQPDVIIMDITMPEMDGIEATRIIHSEFSNIHIIGLSMHEEGEYKTLIKRAGAADLLNKGGPSELLIKSIRTARAG